MAFTYQQMTGISEVRTQHSESEKTMEFTYSGG